MNTLNLVFAVIIAIPLIASAQSNLDNTGLRKPRLSDTDLLSRMERIEKNLVAIQKQVYAEPKASSNPTTINTAATDAQFDELYQQLKSIRGEIEQIQFENSKLNERFVKFSADVEFRLNELTQNKGIHGDKNNKFDSIDEELNQNSFLEGSDQQALQQRAAGQPNHSNNQPINLLNKSPDEVYQQAYTLLKEREYDQASKIFQEFVDKNPNHTMVANAYFWIGETKFQKSLYEDAAVKYLKGYQSSPKGTKASDNLLKLGESLAKLHKNKEACLTYVKLKKEFPNATSNIKKKVDEQIISLNCK